MKKSTCLFALAALACLWSSVAAPAPAWPAANPAAVERWQAMRFGMFIHWGPVTLTGREIGWSRGSETPNEVYDNLYKQFNPTNYNADEWVSIAKAAGMKYLVLTTKHHDGFCLWDTKQTDYNIMNTPFKRDVVKDLAAACERQGIAFGAYYSTCDWYHPAFPLGSPGGNTKKPNPDLAAYDDYLRKQTTELATQYGPLVLMWFDVPQVYTSEYGVTMVRKLRELQPDILINNRAYAEPGRTKNFNQQRSVGDFDTPEQRIGNYQDDRPWETCMTICRQWSWKPNDDMKSLKQCLQTLITCAGGDGNLLFNVGPTPDGVIEARQVERLKEMGAWLARNGESIYGTRGGPWKPTPAVASTRKGNTVYLHLLREEDGVVELPDLGRKVKSAALLASGQVTFTQAGGKLHLKFDQAAINPIDTIIRLELDGSAMDIPAIPLSSAIKATASNVFQQQEGKFGAGLAFDNDSKTRWATDNSAEQWWIAADLGETLTIQRVRIEEAIGERVQEFELQYRSGDEWKTIFTGTKIGHWFQRKLDPPVTAREFRLNVLRANKPPTISDIEFIEE